MLFRNRQRAFCVDNAVIDSHARRAAVRSWNAFTSIFVKGSFRRAHLTHDGRRWVGTTRGTRAFRNGRWWKSKVLRIIACERARWTPSCRPLARRFDRGLPSRVHFLIRTSLCSASSAADLPLLLCLPIPALGEPFVIFLAQNHLYEKCTSESLTFYV